MRKIFFMKKATAAVTCIAVLLMAFSACGSTDEPAGELSIEWVDPGIEYESLKFEAAGEGLYLLEAVLEGGFYKFGYMDGAGDIVIPVIYDQAGIFSEGAAYVVLGERKSFIDPSGVETIDVSEYGYVAPFEFGFAMFTRVYTEEIENGVRLTHRCGLIDPSGREVLPGEYEEAGALENGLIWAALDGKFAIFESSGRRLTPYEFDSVGYADEDLIVALKEEKYGYLDIKGNVAIPFEFDIASRFYDGLAFVAVEWLAGYINPSGEQITPIEFDEANDFSEGRAAVSKDGMFGFIDTEGNVAVPFMYDEVWPFDGGVAVALKRAGSAATRITTIDKYGEPAIIPDDMGYFKWKDTYIAYSDPEYATGRFDYYSIALLSDEGVRLTGFVFSDIFDFYEGFAVTEKSIEPSLFYGLINQNGAEILPAIHDRVEIADKNTVLIQYSDAESGRSMVGIVTLPGEAAKMQPPDLE